MALTKVEDTQTGSYEIEVVADGGGTVTACWVKFRFKVTDDVINTEQFFVRRENVWSSLTSAQQTALQNFLAKIKTRAGQLAL